MEPGVTVIGAEYGRRLPLRCPVLLPKADCPTLALPCLLPRCSAPGVAGHEVTLQPGQSFAYHSTVQLATATGSVDGMFDVVVQHSMLSAGGGGGNEEGAADWGAPFKVPLGRVALNHKAPSWGGGADNPSAPA